MHTIDLRDLPSSQADLARVIPRAITDVATASAVAAQLISDVSGYYVP